MNSALKILILATLFTLGACASPTEPPVPTETPIPPSPTADLGIGPFLTVNKAGDLYLKSPYGAAVNQAGEIYISDAGNSRVLKFDSSGTLLAAWDKKGSGDGEFNSMGFGGLAVDPSGNVFVVDNGNHRIQKFDGDGN
ncbi:MAG TPA: hypothetical protein PLN43_01705, partial [Anaerolineales bacterium]|nr:hypothetical protein [Anaerolineales bacterium]